MGLGTGATAAIVGGIGAAGSIASGVIGANAAGNAASTQAAAANHAADLQSQQAAAALAFEKQVYGDQQTNQRPFLQAGQGATYSLANLLGINMPQQTTAPNAAIPPQLGGTSVGSNSAFGPGSGGGIQPTTPGTVNRLALPPSEDTTGLGQLSALAGQAPIQLPSNQAPIVQPNSGTPGGVINASGSPGTVALTNGTPTTGEPADFGSLLQGYGQQFVAPTDVTEQNDPGYQFRLQQGNDAIQRSAAARGGLLSGGTAKALSDYAQGSASQEYGNVYNRAMSTFDSNYNQFNNDQTNKFNRLASLAGFGQTAAGQLSTAGSNAANNVSSTLLTSGQQIGNDIQNAGAANASGYVGGANAINGAIGGGTSSLLNGILLSQFLGGGNSGGQGV